MLPKKEMEETVSSCIHWRTWEKGKTKKRPGQRYRVWSIWLGSTKPLSFFSFCFSCVLDFWFWIVSLLAPSFLSNLLCSSSSSGLIFLVERESGKRFGKDLQKNKKKKENQHDEAGGHEKKQHIKCRSTVTAVYEPPRHVEDDVNRWRRSN